MYRGFRQRKSWMRNCLLQYATSTNAWPIQSVCLYRLNGRCYGLGTGALANRPQWGKRRRARILNPAAADCVIRYLCQPRLTQSVLLDNTFREPLETHKAESQLQATGHCRKAHQTAHSARCTCHRLYVSRGLEMQHVIAQLSRLWFLRLPYHLQYRV